MMNQAVAIPEPAGPPDDPESDSTRVSEAHHRIGNSLALIASIVRMQARAMLSRSDAVPVADVRLLVEELGQRLEALGRLHGKLARLDGPVDLADYLRDIAKSAVSGLAFAGRMHLHFDIPDTCIVSARVAPLVGLAVSELVMNAVKFAHPTGVTGDLQIACNRCENAIVVEVSDDGVGLPEGFDPTVDGQFGLQLLRSLSGQLKARLEFVSTGIGLSVRLSIPAMGSTR
jgi:two-component sensor histidine kinase